MTNHAPHQARAHGAYAGDLEPSTHINVRADVTRRADDPDGSRQMREAAELAMRTNGFGGLIVELKRRPNDPNRTIRLTAVMTVAQAVEMLFDEAQERVGTQLPPDAPPLDSRNPVDPIARWLAAEHEDVRLIGVPRLAAVLIDAGFEGDVAAAADELWTACGY